MRWRATDGDDEGAARLPGGSDENLRAVGRGSLPPAFDRTTTGLPIFGHLGGREHIVYGVGWRGNGVGPSVLGGKILSSLALRQTDEWSASPLVDRRFGHFPPEPVRFLGAHVVREGVIRKEQAEARGETPRSLWVHLARLAPAGIEDKD